MTLMRELQDITDSTLVLASTERVARHLKVQASLLQSISGKRSWFSKGVISTVSAWIETTWLDQMPDEQLLFPVQELAIVKNVADKSGLLPPTLISSTSTARRISKAFSLTHKYQLPADPESFLFKREYEVFAKWREQITAACAADGCVFRAELPARLLQMLNEGSIAIPERIVIVGMLDMNPAEKSLFDALAERGSEVVHYSGTDELATPTLVRAETQAQEFSQVAQWVNSMLLPYSDTPLAAPSIAILVPEMRTYQGPLLEALALTVSPASLLPAKDGIECREPWDVSSGATLGARPMIRAAMDILSITEAKADTETFSRVLRSRWVGGSEIESDSRALMDIWLRENLGLAMTGKDFLRAIKKNKNQQVPDFEERLAAVLTSHAEADESMFPSEWAEFFEESLKTMGWPETRELSSANFQTLNAWQEALTLFRTLDTQLGGCKYERAFMWLREIVDTRQFQPRIGHVAPVSIMGYADAIGLTFDHVWMIGASSNVLPMPAEPNPFLPVELQAAAGIPESTSELSLQKAQKVVHALMGISQNITVSCPLHDDKGSGIGASELFGVWPQAGTDSQDRGLFVTAQLNQLDRSVFVEEYAPPVSDEELLTIKGGVKIFKDYALSPFLAFASSRLGAYPFPAPIVGLDPRIQGTTIHRVLELFWTDVKTSAALKSMDSDQLADKVSEKVELASEQLLNRLVWRYGARLIGLEKKRLHALTMDWLDYEKTRVYEFEVVGTEERHEITVGKVPLKVTIDRRDRVLINADEHRNLVIDYKSGKSTPLTGLNAESLVEPQLPIYATQIDNSAKTAMPIDGVSLAQVHAANISTHVRSDFAAGLVERKPRNGDVGTPEAWNAQCVAWDRALQEMSAGFMAGVATLIDADKAMPIGYEYVAPLTR